MLRRTDRLIIGSIDDAAHVLQRRARDVLVGSAVFLVPLMAFNVLLAVFTYDRFETVDGLLGDRGYIGAEAGFVALALMVQSFSAHLIGAYTSVILVGHQMGHASRILPGVTAVLRRLPVLVVTWVVSHWWAPLLMWWLLNVDASTAQVLGFVLSWGVAALSAAALLVTPVVMTEHLGLRSLGRAWRLVRTRFGAAYGFVWACGLLSVALATFIGLLPTLAEQTGFITFGSFDWLVRGVAAQLALLVVVPFTAIATAQLYLQIRIHAEGLDIVLAADRAFPAS
jgi:hypothetical protein